MNILVVDDNQLNLSIVKRYLEEITNITKIILNTDPSKTIKLMNENEIDILILDIIMPGITGLDILTQLRLNPKFDDILIIMLTSLDDPQRYKKCFELGAFDYIIKPINKIEFNARLRVAIEWKNNTNYLKSLIEVTSKQNIELKEINAKLTEAQFGLVQSEKMAAIGLLAAGIAHEINNPMGYISSNFDILKKYFKRITEFIDFIQEKCQSKSPLKDSQLQIFTQEVEEKYKSLKLDVIMNETEGIFTDSEAGILRVTEIVQSFRVFARSSADDEKDTNVLLTLIKEVLLITKNEIKYVAKVKLAVPDDVIIYCNRVQLSQVFVNIILNAAYAIKSQIRDTMGMIKISAHRLNDKIMIVIEDDGPGIPEENLSKIFEPFFTTKEIGQGTGLGLSISYDIIVNKHNGSIEVKSELGKGTTFLIILPIIAVN